ncbi:MAG: U3 small nucleolar RNA-associated protein 13 [Watsoniomyces obsoletus]|nr:MAG: U3 small nucleolar RNA-associated protein 13 [Watsoniomyces obsoletus]
MNSAGESIPPTPSSQPLESRTTSTTTFSLALHASKTKAPPRPSSTPLVRLNGRSKNGAKRPHSSLHASDDDEDDEGDNTAQAQLVSGFDHAAGGAIEIEGQMKPEQQPLVIAKLKNRNWREESIRRRRAQRGAGGGLPGAAPQQNGNEAEDDTTNVTTQSFGLTFVERKTEKVDIDAGVNGHGEAVAEAAVEDEDEQKSPPKPKTDDELALEALLKDKSERKSNLVLPMSTNPTNSEIATRSDLPGPAISEDDAFRIDVLSRPDSASLEDYAAIPVEEFGAALLRGMGWKEGDVVGKRKQPPTKMRVVERRPALLGIGAKELPGEIGGGELSAWGKGVVGGGNGNGKMKVQKGRQRETEKVYNPVVLRNRETGEMLTEEELRLKIEEASKGKEDDHQQEEDWKERRDRNLRRDRERKEREGRGERRERYFNSFPLVSSDIALNIM